MKMSVASSSQSWAAPPDGDPEGASREVATPRDLFEHRAVLYTAEGTPFAEVVETYRSGLLAFRRR